MCFISSAGTFSLLSLTGKMAVRWVLTVWSAELDATTAAFLSLSQKKQSVGHQHAIITQFDRETALIDAWLSARPFMMSYHPALTEGATRLFSATLKGLSAFSPTHRDLNGHGGLWVLFIYSLIFFFFCPESKKVKNRRRKLPGLAAFQTCRNLKASHKSSSGSGDASGAPSVGEEGWIRSIFAN